MHNRFYRFTMSLTAIFGLAGVILGAFGAHFLKSRLSETDIETFKTGVLYLFIHVLASYMILSPVSGSMLTIWRKWAVTAFLAGILLFSGSLFILSTRHITGIPASMIGIVTPLGGVFFVAGWFLVLADSLKHKSLP